MKTIWDFKEIEILPEIKKKFLEYRSRAKSKKIKFKIHIKEFQMKVKDSCYICNKENSGGLDRVDNTKGYIVANVYPCCFDCNRMKSNKTQQEFLLYLKRLNPEHPLLKGFNALTRPKDYARKVRSLRRMMTKMWDDPAYYERLNQ